MSFARQKLGVAPHGQRLPGNRATEQYDGLVSVTHLKMMPISGRIQSLTKALTRLQHRSFAQFCALTNEAVERRAKSPASATKVAGGSMSGSGAGAGGLTQ